MKRCISLIGILIVIFMLTSCAQSSSKEIRFADAGWDSAKVHNAIAGFIAEKAYGYKWSEIPGSTSVLHEGIKKGEVDVHMEMWTDNLVFYEDDVQSGAVQELGVNFDDNMQGIYVPRYVIEGDEKRGIKPTAPDLKTVADLKKYPDVFPDDENPSKGRIYGAIPGWVIDEIMFKKYNHYGLNENFVYFRPGSDAALAAALTEAFEKGKPIAGYYWEPTWLMGKYDFVLLEDAPYDKDLYPEGKTACPAVKVTIIASNDFVKSSPDIVAFLKKYSTTSAQISEALAYMQDSGANYLETAKWFLKKNDGFIEGLLPADKAKLVKEALK